jgi:Uma2 family endonuclease
MEAEEPITEYSKLNLEGSYTYRDYLKWHFKERVELIRGKVFLMTPPAPNTKHQVTNRNLIALLLGDGLNGRQLFIAPFDVRLPVPQSEKDSTVVQPDLCIVCDASKLDKHGCNGAPDFMLEILSRGNSKHEVDTKFSVYQESGVKEYSFVDCERRSVLVFSLQENHTMNGLRPFTEGQTIQSPLFPELQIRVTDVFKGIAE